MSADAPDPVREYLLANREKYTREAIREQLLAAGHDIASVDAALAEPEMGGAPSSPPGSAVAGFARVPFVIAAIIGAFGAVLLVSLSGYGASLSVPAFLAAFAVSYGAIGYGIVRLMRWAGPRFKITGLWAGLLGFALFPIYAALMFGTCVGAYSLAHGGG